MPGLPRVLALFLMKACAMVSLSASTATAATESYADLKRACEASEPRACYQLGVMHEEGRGAQKHLRHAAGLYEKACTGGYPNACTNLGTLYLRGLGVEADPSRAATLFESACNANRAEACLQLGSLYVEGKGVQRDELAGLGFFEKACKLGDKRGCLSNSTGGTSATPAPASGGFADGTPAAPASVSGNQGARFHLLLTLGLQFGGEALVEFRWSDGETSQLRAGSGVNITLGGLLEPYRGPIHTLQLQGTVGYSYTGTSALNGSAQITHVPVELLAFYYHRPSHLRIGGGPQYQINSSFVGTGAIAGTVPFDNALGLVLQAEWLPYSVMSVYARYTLIRHPLAGSSESVTGGGFGAGLGFILPGVE